VIILSESSLFRAMENMTRTENDMPSFKTTLNKCVDLFFAIGASRGKDIIDLFREAYDEDREMALRILLWSRDIRAGAGERQIFRDLVPHFELTDKFIEKIPEVGRWDDLLCLLTGSLYEDKAINLIKQALVSGNGLCAKWMPRKGSVASILRKKLNMHPAQYRKLLVGLTKVVETQMCSNQWTSIEYEKVPSLASARYQKAFERHDPNRYGEYKEALSSGDAKINAGAIYPYDCIKSLAYGDEEVANAQWAALPDWVADNTSFLPVVDTSGSMTDHISRNLTAMDVAVSLGLYLSERCKGVFKDHFMTFSRDPELQKVDGSLYQRVSQLKSAAWSMNTDLAKVFDLILNAAVSHRVPEEHMPTMVIILSDMQFDACAQGTSALVMIDKKYVRARYTMPKVVFWNLDDRSGNIPVTVNDHGVALVSGFSPSIMKSVLSCKQLDPVSAMKETVCVERYDI